MLPYGDPEAFDDATSDIDPAVDPVTYLGTLMLLLGIATPLAVKGAVVFLASPAAAYITGCVLTVDGGMTG